MAYSISKVSPGDMRALRQVDALLEQEGIQRDGNLDYIAALYDEDFRVILDLNPAAKGHALILPKQHAANLFELPEEVAAKAMKVAKKVGTVLAEGLSCDGLNVLQNNGEPAGQTVFHFHMHLIPRWKGDAKKIHRAFPHLGHPFIHVHMEFLAGERKHPAEDEAQGPQQDSCIQNRCHIAFLLTPGR